MIPTIVNHLWQSTVFALLAGLVVLSLRKHGARVRYWVWFAASVKFLVPLSLLSWVGSELSWRAQPVAVDTAQGFVATMQQLAAPVNPSLVTVATVASAQGFDLMLLVAGLWVLGCVAFALRWFARWRAVAREVRAGTNLEMRLALPVKLSQRLHEPVVVGIVRPVMLLPHGIAQRLDAAQLHAVVAHELCHARHRDNLTAAIHMVVEVLFWFHPLVWWLGARLIDERERACDEAVLAAGHERERYAEGILKVCQLYVESRIACAAGISGADLKQRIEAIMKNRITDKLSHARRAVLIAAATATLVAPFAVGLAAGGSQGAAGTPMNETGLAYDTVEIRKAVVDSDAKLAQKMLMLDGGAFRVRNMSLRSVIGHAYGVQSQLVVGGPTWLDEPRYDIDATSGVVDSAVQGEGAQKHKQMAKALLAKEFGLIAHTETQQTDTYVLRVDQGGAKLTATERTSGNTGMKLGRDGVTGMSASMGILVHYIGMRLKQPVVDQTGLTGAYDFDLKSTFKAETLPRELKEQLGLVLERELVPTQVVVVDGVTEPQGAALSASANPDADK